ncbi:MAG: ferritin family protein [Candidatus Omnitrophota bacterium]
MQVYRCRICGDVYIGEAKPKSCPFCGAHESYFVLAKEWELLHSVTLSDATKENLKKALDLEINNTNFYKAVSQKSKHVYVSSMFKGLSKVEAEHASVICKHLRIEKPDSNLGFDKAVDPSINSGSTLSGVEWVDSDQANIEEANRRERGAVKFYGQASNQAPEKEIKEFFKALTEIESDHIVLTD